MLCNFILSVQLRKAHFSLDFVCWRTFRAVFEEREYFLVPTRDLRGWAWNFACEACEVQGFGLTSSAGEAELRCGAFIHFYLWQQKLSSLTLACTRNNCVLNGWWTLGRIYFPLNIIFFPFSMQRFSCIIGPNGSGKSNIIDSLLFVFGYRAQKIRSKKLSVLIHNSDEHKDIQSCSVEVHFQKITDKVCMIPGTAGEPGFFL